MVPFLKQKLVYGFSVESLGDSLFLSLLCSKISNFVRDVVSFLLAVMLQIVKTSSCSHLVLLPSGG